MIYNGQDYQPYNSVITLSSPGTLYLYYYLGDSGFSYWTVSNYSASVQSVVIGNIGSSWYAFVEASYPQKSTYRDEVDISRNNVSPAITMHFEWQAIVGTSTYSGPIWKDYIYQVPFQAPRVQFLLKFNGNSIYKGWSYASEYGDIEICPNEILRDYLGTSFPEALDVWYQDYQASRRFELFIGLSEDAEPDTKVADLSFLYDWSYSDYLDYQYDSFLAMEPLQDYYDTRQFHIFSVNSYATLRNTSRTLQYVNLNDARSHIKLQLPADTYELFGYDAPGLKRFKFTVKDNCGIRYCLYYVNSRGGWDSVLVDGVSTQADKYDRETFTQNYRTPSIQRGVIEYRNNITESWTLYLRSLGDNKNKLFHNLYESTNVYLHDLEEGRIVPVIITSREMQYKTRKNQGRKLYTYEIQVESSQRKLRM